MSRKSFRISTALAILLASTSLAAAQNPGAQGPDLDQKIRSSVVIVRVQKQIAGPGAEGLRRVLLNGVLVDALQQQNLFRVIQSNGVTFDEKGHVLSYVGYKWMALNPKDPGARIEVIRSDGQTGTAKLVGIDQRSGLAILQASPEIALIPRPYVKTLPSENSTTDCLLVDLDSREPVRKVQLHSTPAEGEPQYYLPGAEGLDQGQLLFDPEEQFLGFVTGGEPSARPGAKEVYPAARLATSIKRILDTNRDIPSGWLGVHIDDLPSQVGGQHVVVTKVVTGSPAEQAGLMTGDVLMQVEGKSIRSSEEFSRKVRWAELGSRLKLHLERRGQPRVLPVQVAARPENAEPTAPMLYLQVSPGTGKSQTPQIELREIQALDQGRPGMLAPGHPFLGIQGDDLTPQLGKFFGVDGGRGVLVISVVPGTLAARFGMKAGDVIVSLNGEPVVDQLQFWDLLGSHGAAKAWDFRVVRERKPVEVRIPLASPEAKNPK